jgi:hypothetical protein
MGITKKIQMEELEDKCEICIYWNSPERAKMDEDVEGNTCRKCNEVVEAGANCQHTSMKDYCFESKYDGEPEYGDFD